MLNHPTHERLIELGLTGMAKAFEEQRRSPDLEALPFEDRIGLLVDREAAERDTRRLTTRLKIAALRQTACVEDVDLRPPRGIDRAVFAKLVEGRWIDRHENLLVTGATGLGKSWLAARSATRPAATTDQSSIIAFQGCSRRSRSRAETDVTPGSSKASAALSF
ncbi:DNA replication protein DnaC [Bradyrhizobium liaoningense]